MEPAVEPFRAALDDVELHEPRFPVVSCSTTEPFADVRAELAAALTSPVRWRETMLALHEAGVTPLRRGRPRQGARAPRQAHPARRPGKVETPPEPANA